MADLNELLKTASGIKGIVSGTIAALVAAVILSQVNPWLSGLALLCGVGLVAYGLVRPDGGGVTRSTTGHLEAIANVEELSATSRLPQLTELEWVLYKNLKNSTEERIGRGKRLQVRFFLDLREACLVKEQRRLLSRTMADYVRKSFDVSGLDVVIIPKFGNVPLGLDVAEELGLGPVVIRQWAIYGRSIESVRDGGKGILVDDVWADGEELIDVVLRARDAGFSIQHACLFVRRPEGNVLEQLAANGIPYCGQVMTLGDEEFASLVERARS